VEVTPFASVGEGINGRPHKLEKISGSYLRLFSVLHLRNASYSLGEMKTIFFKRDVGK
jgi:hypothetical protein